MTEINFDNIDKVLHDSSLSMYFQDNQNYCLWTFNDFKVECRNKKYYSITWDNKFSFNVDENEILDKVHAILFDRYTKSKTDYSMYKQQIKSFNNARGEM